VEQKKSKPKKVKKAARLVTSGLARILATFNNTIVSITPTVGSVALAGVAPGLAFNISPPAGNVSMVGQAVTRTQP
jgi:ribosomal protein S11